jgi:hypothetical protein
MAEATGYENYTNAGLDAEAKKLEMQAAQQEGPQAAPAENAVASTPLVNLDDVVKTSGSTPIQTSGKSAETSSFTSSPESKETKKGRGKDKALDPIKPSQSKKMEAGVVRHAPSMTMEDNIRLAKGKPGFYGLGAGIVKAGYNLETGKAKATGALAKTGLPGGKSYSATDSLFGSKTPAPRTPGLRAAPGMAPGGGSSTIRTQAEQKKKALRDEKRNRDGLYMEDGETSKLARQRNIKAEKDAQAFVEKAKRGEDVQIDEAERQRVQQLKQNPFYMEPKMAMAPKGPKFDQKTGKFINKGDEDILNG